MARPFYVVTGIIEDDGCPAVSNLVANGLADFQFAACIETERNAILDLAGNPLLLRDSSDRRKAHAGRLAYVP